MFFLLLIEKRFGSLLRIWAKNISILLDNPSLSQWKIIDFLEVDNLRNEQLF